MKHVDMRKLPAAAQEERRRQVIGLRQGGLTYRCDRGAGRADPDRGVRHLQALAARARGLVSKPRGPEPGGRLLDAAQEAEVQT